VNSVVSEKLVKEHAGTPDGLISVTDDNYRDDWMDENGPAACTGPYTLKSWQHNQIIILERFDKYWGPKPAIKTVILEKVVDVNTRKLQLLNGEADIVYIPVTNDEDVYRMDKKLVRVIEGNPTFALSFFGMNQRVAPSAVEKGEIPATDFFKDVEMRKMFVHSFDYKSFIDNIVRGHGIQARGIIPKGMFGHVDDLPIPQFNVAKAREHFQKTKYADSGFEITLTYNEGNKVREQGALLLKQGLESVDEKIKVKIQPVAFNVFVQKQKKSELPLYSLGWAPDFADPDDYVVPFASSTGAFASRIGYKNTMVDELIDKAAREQDQNTRRQLYRDIEHAVLGDAPYIMSYQATNFHVQRTWVQGYYYNPMFSNLLYSSLYKAAPAS
jgi:peptide/nickel transport system substrate-binding protein